LEAYVKEIDSNKENVILVNKADYLTQKQRFVGTLYLMGKCQIS